MYFLNENTNEFLNENTKKKKKRKWLIISEKTAQENTFF